MGISKSLENPQKLPFWSRVVVLGLFWPFLPPKKKRVGIESAAAAVGVLEWSWAASSFDRFSKAISSIGKRSSYTNALSLSVGSKGINCNETLSIYSWDHHRQEMKLIFQRWKKMPVGERGRKWKRRKWAILGDFPTLWPRYVGILKLKRSYPAGGPTFSPPRRSFLISCCFDRLISLAHI